MLNFVSAYEQVQIYLIVCPTLRQIAGPAGCGKTQFSIMLSVLATMPRQLGGLDGAVIYIDTEGAFSAER